ncbi:MAG: hypothetical protein Q9201_007504 [Fulgogasparrea decipioides]
MDVEEDDGYSDDDLDALPDDTFRQLQEQAFVSTQQTARANHAPFSSVNKPQGKVPGDLAGGLERLSVGNTFPVFEPQADPEFANQPSSDYGDLDDEMLDGEIYDAADEPGVDAIQVSRAAAFPYGESTQREQWRNQRYGLPSTHVNPGIVPAPVRPQLSNGTNDRHVKEGNAQGTFSAIGSAQPSRQPDVEALHAQINELRRERVELEKAKKAAEDVALAKSGEIAIIRANQSKSERIFESKLTALQKLHAEEAARQKLAVERALAEKHKIATEKGFLQNDIAEGHAQIRDLQRAVKAKTKATSGKDDERAGPPATPRKNRILDHGDGFDDDEIQMASSSRLPYRSKTNTPKAGSKRKRKPIDASPVKPLQLSQTNEAANQGDIAIDILEQSSFSAAPVPPAVPTASRPTAFPAAARPNDRFNLAQHVMNHRMAMYEKRTFEVLSEYCYPSKPDTAMSTVFLDKISILNVRSNIDNFPVALAQVIVSMWKQCVDEQYWRPVHLLLDLVDYILCITPVTTAPLLVDTLLEVIQSTADVNVMPRVRRQPARFSADVNTLDCLELLKSIANDCLMHKEDIIRFWRRMRFDFIAMILNVVQPIEVLHITLNLLRTSVQKDTFAIIVPPNDGKQEPSERNLIDLLTRLLVENIKPLKNEKPYDVVDIGELRLNVLSLMEEMCENQHSSHALASSQHAIGRLVWVMNDELDALYDRRYGHECKAELVNQATRLLFRLRTDHPRLINMQEKLKVVPCSGGVHKHLIALTRLALSEGVFFEEEIEDDVVECAYEMLEDLSSPEEAEALREAFSTARSR